MCLPLGGIFPLFDPNHTIHNEFILSVLEFGIPDLAGRYRVGFVQNISTTFYYESRRFWQRWKKTFFNEPALKSEQVFKTIDLPECRYKIVRTLMSYDLTVPFPRCN